MYHHSDVSQSSSAAGAMLYDKPEIDSDSDFTENAPYMGKVLSRPVTLKQLLATLKQPGYLETEFRKLPPNHVDPSEIPPGAEKKNRYSNVLPCLRTRVPLGIQGNVIFPVTQTSLIIFIVNRERSKFRLHQCKFRERLRRHGCTVYRYTGSDGHHNRRFLENGVGT